MDLFLLQFIHCLIILAPNAHPMTRYQFAKKAESQFGIIACSYRINNLAPKPNKPLPFISYNRHPQSEIADPLPGDLEAKFRVQNKGEVGYHSNLR